MLIKNSGRRKSFLFAVCLTAASCLVSTSWAGNPKPSLGDSEVLSPASSAFDWRSFYIGGSFGYGFGVSDRVGHRTPAGALLANAGTLSVDGFNYGLRLGWRNWATIRSRKWVYGMEIAYRQGDVGGTTRVAGRSSEVNIDETLSLRFRSGLTNQADTLWVYGILGYVRSEIEYSVVGTISGDSIDVDDVSDRSGFVLGLGVERLLKDDVSLTFDVEFTEFGSYRLEDLEGSSTIATPSFWNFRLGLNYSF